MTRTALRYLVRAIAALFVLATVILVGVAIYIRTASFSQLLMREVKGNLSDLRGEFRIGAIGSSRIGRVDLHDVVIVYQGRELLRAPAIEIGYALLPLLWHEVALTVTVQSPRVSVARDRNGDWDLADALQSTAPSAGGGPSPYNVVLSTLLVRDGSIEAAPNGLNGSHYLIGAANLDGRLELLSSGLKVKARRLTAHLQAPNAPVTDVSLTASYDGSSSSAVAELTSLHLTTRKSALSATATLRNRESPWIEAHIDLARLARDDLSGLPSYPLRDDVAGSIDVKGPLNALHAVIALAAGPARVQLTADGDISSKHPAYEGALTLQHLDLGRLEPGVRLAGQLDSSIQVRGTGTELAALSGTVKADGSGLIINNIRVGHAILAGETKNGDGRLTAVIAGQSTKITADASVANLLAPHLRAKIVTQHLDLQELTGSPAQPKSDINGTLALDAPHLDPARLDLGHIDASMVVNLARSSLRNAVIERGSADTNLHAGIVRVAQLKVNAESASLEVQGTLGVAPRSATRIAYSLRSPRLAPLLQIARLKGDGRVDLSGTANGSLFGADAPGLHAQGRAVSRNLTIAGVTTSAGSFNYDVSGIGRSGLPLGRAQCEFADIAAGKTRLRRFNAVTQITRQSPAALTLAVEVVDARGNRHSAGGNLAIEKQGIVKAALTQLTLTESDGRWNLGAPAYVVVTPRAISIVNFEIRNGSRKLALNGTMSTTGRQNISFTARNLDLKLMEPLFQPNQGPAGTVTADISITGSASAPMIHASLIGNGLAMHSQRIGDLALDAEYKPGATNVNFALSQDRTNQTTLTGTVPMILDWVSGFHVHLGNDIALRLYSARMDLGGLAQLAPPRILKDGTGQLVFDLTINGSPFHPAVRGTLALKHLGGEVVPLGLKISDSSANMRVAPELFTLDQLVIRTGDGSINGSGTVTLANSAPDLVDLTVTLQQCPVIQTERYQGTAGGELHLRGHPEALGVTGRLEVLNAVVHPDLAFLTATKYSRDDTIMVIRPGGISQPAAVVPITEQGAGSTTGNAANHSHTSLFDNLLLDVAIVVHRDTWIRHPNASIELDGHLRATKQRGAPLILTGRIDTIRGWIIFNHQTFTVASGEIVFTGGRSIDPSLSLDARHSVSDYTVDVLVSGYSSKPQVKLQSSPALPQADILSLLLFGKTTSSLGHGQNASLRQQAAKMAAGATAATIGQALSSSLGLEDLGIDLNSASANGGVGFGRYLGKNTYLSAVQSTTGRKVSIQYYIERWVSITSSTNSDGSSEIVLKVTREY